MVVREGAAKQREVQTRCQDGPSQGPLRSPCIPWPNPEAVEGERGFGNAGQGPTWTHHLLACPGLHSAHPRTSPRGTGETEPGTRAEAEPGSKHSPGAPATNWPSTPQSPLLTLHINRTFQSYVFF